MVLNEEIQVTFTITRKIALDIAKHLDKDLSNIHLDLQNPAYVGEIIKELLIAEF